MKREATVRNDGARAADRRRVWFITGASSGFGRSLAEAVAEHGDCLVATARDTDDISDLVDAEPERVRALELDVTDRAQVRAAIEEAVAAFGHIDVVVNNAGYGLFGALEEFPEEELRKQFETNVFGVLNVTRTALPHLRRQHSGHLVQMSSLDGVAPIAAGESAYAATKFAVEGFSETLANEVAHLGIKVTIVEPGPSRTDFAGRSPTTKSVENDDYDETVGKALDWFAHLHGTQPGDPDRVARAIIEAVEADEPPLHLALGELALGTIRKKLEERSRELEAWEKLSASTDFDSARPSA
ncbi:MAG TPA: oxidoreductase [Rhodanobacteraceae bacterium]|nr:oxidoreductase [Rhodanobacteraceae bacterium]